MEVEGKKILEKYCLLCKNHGKKTQANGYCDNCEQYMCNTCFRNHKMLKVARDHNFIDNENGASVEVTADNKDELDVCAEHDECIKFYCPSHDVVGCGECIVLGHKPCNVEYVREKAKVLTGSEDFTCFVKGLSQCQEKISAIESTIKNNNEKVSDINKNFVASVNTFTDEIVSHVNKVADEIINEAANVASGNRQGMNDIERNCKELSSDITSMQQVLDSHTDQPSKVFVSFIQQKPKLKCIQKELDKIECKNKIDHYHFEPESVVKRALIGSSGIGRLQTIEASNRKSDTLEDIQGAASGEQLTLTGQEFCEYEPVIIDPLKLFIRNIAETTSSEYISRCIASINGAEPVAVTLGETPGTAMLCFETPPDVSKIRKLCDRRKFEGKSWSISVVERTRMVKVTGVHSKTTTDTLEHYFKTKRRSQGGDVDLTECRGMDYIVTFVNAEDAERVCRARQKLHRNELTVALYYPCLELDENLVERTPSPISVEDIDEFISKPNQPGFGGAPQGWGCPPGYNQQFPGQGQQPGAPAGGDPNKPHDPNAAAWAAYYTQYYAQYGQQGQQYGQQPRQSKQPKQPSQPQPTVNPQTGRPDYSPAWAEYYRQHGMYQQANAILAQHQQQQGGGAQGQGGQPPQQ